MVRRNLDRLPEVELPEGFTLRAYRPGDETAWYQIHLAADTLEPPTPELFARRFGCDPAVLTQRQLYLVAAGGETIGTGTAWFDPSFEGAAYGRVHYVAVVPRFQGRGLAKPLVSAVLQRLRELGHDRAYLATSTLRLPAIQLYRRFGFEPLVRDGAEQAIWTEVMERLRSL